ncbi:MAG TPA: hypothetical protein VIK69_11905, partial [Methylophilaceae bacterium]
FHTFFILAGVAVFLPMTNRFARLVERLLPEVEDDLTQRLDDSLLNIPAVALEASQRVIEQVTAQLLRLYGEVLAMASSTPVVADLQRIGRALDRTFDFVTRIQLSPEQNAQVGQRIAQLHAIDHLLRLRHRLSDLMGARVDFGNPVYQTALQDTRTVMHLVQRALAEKSLARYQQDIEREVERLAELVRKARHEILLNAIPNGRTPGPLYTTDVFRWMERTGHHISRICHYLAQGRPGNGALEQAPGTEEQKLEENGGSFADDIRIDGR